MKYAWIENSQIRDIAPGNPNEIYHSDIAKFYDTDVPDDVVNGATLVAGVWTNPPPPPAPVPPTQAELDAIAAAAYQATVPKSVTMRQARLALLAAGLLDTVETAITAAGLAAKIEWDYATEVQRSSGLVPAMATALGMTETQIDALFVAAAGL